MSDTPRTDEVFKAVVDLGFGSMVEIPTGYPPCDVWELARQLERELNSANAEITRLKGELNQAHQELDKTKSEMERAGVEGEAQLAYIAALKNDRDAAIRDCELLSLDKQDLKNELEYLKNG